MLSLQRFPLTRHPFATNVAVNKQSFGGHKAGDLYEDLNAGEFSWIPAGEISLKIPYSEETKSVRVKMVSGCPGYWSLRIYIPK